MIPEAFGKMLIAAPRRPPNLTDGNSLMIRNLIVSIGILLICNQVSPRSFAQPGDANTSGWAYQLKSRFRIKQTEPCPPFTLVDIAQKLDVLEEGIMDDGTVVIKQPDIWGQGRMTKFRVEFEKTMAEDLGKFAPILSARIARSDQASFESSTAVGSALAGQARGPLLGSQIKITPESKLDANAVSALADQNKTALAILDKQISERDALLSTALGLLADDKTVSQKAPFGFLPSGAPFQNISTGDGKLGLEPTIVLDEKKRYLDHLHEIRRVNLGDDNADRAGYGLYLIRMPVSIQPGEKSQRGHGATVDVTVRPDFGPAFLQDTYRSLVVADLVDLLSPVVFEMLGRYSDEELEELLGKILARKIETLKFKNESDKVEMLKKTIQDLEETIPSLEKTIEDSKKRIKNLEILEKASPALVPPPAPGEVEIPKQSELKILQTALEEAKVKLTNSKVDLKTAKDDLKESNDKLPNANVSFQQAQIAYKEAMAKLDPP